MWFLFDIFFIFSCISKAFTGYLMVINNHFVSQTEIFLESLNKLSDFMWIIGPDSTQLCVKILHVIDVKIFYAV
jgi:hypothetical protein